MSDLESLLKNFFIISDQLPNFNKDLEYKDDLSLHADLKKDKNWDLFFSTNFSNVGLQKKFESFSEEERRKIFTFGITCFVQFVNCNFTGPGLHEEIVQYLTHDKFSKIPFIKHLSVHHEEVNINIKFPALLVTAKLIFEHCLVDVIVNNWWLWRSTLIHQEILDELSPNILSEADNIYKLLYTDSNLIGR